MLIGLTEFVMRRARLVVTATLLSGLAFGYGLRFMKADTDVTQDLPRWLPAKEVYDRIDQLFPSKEVVIAGIEGGDLWTVEGIARVDRFTRRAEKLDGVQSVMSPTNARLISAVEGGMEVRPAADPLPATPEDAARLKARLFGQPLFVGSLVSRDGQAMAMLVFVKAGTREADVASRLINLAQDPAANEGLTFHVTGRAAATHWSKVLMGRDMGMLSSAALGVIILLLVAIFRSMRGVFLPLGVVVLSVVWTLGLMGWVGIPISHSTEVLPILLVSIGVADGIHILKGYYQRARGATDRQAVVRATMADLNRPVVVTSVTTAVGFLALNTSGIDSIMRLGLLTAFGVMAAMLFSLTFIPAVLVMLALPRVKDAQGRHFLKLEELAARYGGLLVAHRGKVTLGVLVVVALAVAGAFRVPVEMSNLSNFRPDHPFRLATEAVNRHFAGASNLTVVVEGGRPDAIKDPAVLAKMDELESWLRKQPHVGSVQSVVGFIKQMNRVMHRDAPEAYRLPGAVEQETGVEVVEENGQQVERPVTFEVPGRELVAQYLALYEMSGKPGDFANLVTYDYSTARINVFLDSDQASHLGVLHDTTSAFIASHFGELRAELTGMAELIRAVNNLVITGQAWSILTSLLLVLVVTALLFRSLTLGLFSTLPLLFSLFLNFGVMGLSGIALNVMTMATSSVAVGVGVDYAIHFVHRYQQDRGSGLDYGEALLACLRSSGVAILFNAFTVAVGFCALGLSDFEGVRHMGLLIALTMLTSAFGALTILPVLFLHLRPRVFAVASRQ